jgi:hypothetical protein
VTDPILAGLQDAIDKDDDGTWRVSYYAAIVFYERLDADGELIHGLSLYSKDGQPDFITEALIAQGDRLREGGVGDGEDS